MKLSQISSYSFATKGVNKGVKQRGKYQSDIQALNNQTIQQNEQKSAVVSFKGKHDLAKAGAGICGALGTAGAIGGTIIMTGGVVLPAVLAYGALSAVSGAILGHIIETPNKKD